jgi:putative ABC transport system substrate-binding protein
MKRREFITLLGGAAAAWPLAAAAQAPRKIPRVGFLLGGSPTVNRHMLDAFQQGLRELGYVEGQNIALEVRWAEGRLERQPALVEELLRLNVDVLVVSNSQAAVAAHDATRTIPIVTFTGDPVSLGLAASLARPGGNVTGLSYLNLASITKRLGFMNELVPGLARVAVLRNPLFAIHLSFWKETEAAARTLGVALQPLDARGPEDYEPAFEAARRADAQALIAFEDPVSIANRRRIVALATHSGVPAIYGFREFPDEGGLMSYGPSFIDMFRRAASFVDKILKGAKPSDLPIEQPTKLEFVINLKTAKALGLTVPLTLQAQADEVIE